MKSNVLIFLGSMFFQNESYLKIHSFESSIEYQKEDSATIRKFKQFSKDFFLAVNSRDTGYLRKHVIFPIRNSTFALFDPNLLNKKIDAPIFFKELGKLFPKDLVKRINEEGKVIDVHSKVPKPTMPL